MTTLFRVETSRFNLNDSHTETWALTDPWCREIGTRISTFQVEHSIVEADEFYGHQMEWANNYLAQLNAKGPYGLTLQPLRNGKDYQASTDSFFHTEEARAAHIAKYIKDAYKRAQKVAAKPKAKRAA